MDKLIKNKMQNLSNIYYYIFEEFDINLNLLILFIN